MSLHQLAKHVQAAGRDEDTQLIHMTPNEIKGLQALAMSHGGSLTINPHTGLPEAGFLKNILPTVVGAGAMMIPGMQPIGAAMIGGGLGLAMSGGNIRQGILAGLGAWGGASLASGLMGAGAAAGAEAGGLSAVEGMAAGAEGLAGPGIQGSQAISNMANLTPEQAAALKGSLGQVASEADLVRSAGMANAAQGPINPWDQITKGFQVTKFDPSYLKQNMLPIGAAALPLLFGDQSTQPGLAPLASNAQIRPYTYSQTQNPNWGQPGQPYFTQSYTAGTPYAAKEGGVINMADGGIAALANEDMYPQSQQKHTAFATPSQMPVSAEVVGSYEPMTDTYTGSPIKFADGGDVQQQLQAARYVAPPVAVVPLAPATNKYDIAQRTPSQSVQTYLTGMADSANQEYNVAPRPLNMLPGGGQNASASDLNKIIGEYYRQNLGRTADQPGLDYWTSQVQNKGMKLGDVVSNIKASPEYQALHPTAAATTQQTIPVTQANFDANAYLAANPDVARGWASSPWEHYQQYGKNEGRPATALANATSTTGPAQADIDAYLAANPTTTRTYNPVTQTYGAPNVTQAQIDAWRAAQAAAMMPTPTYNYIGGAAGGLPKDFKYAAGGPTYGLGSYSDGGRLLKGPGDGVSDDIPAQIGEHQPARLADGEFVVPARIVSELGNGSTDAGARKLYQMMDRVNNKRAKSAKKGKFAINSKADKELPV